MSSIPAQAGLKSPTNWRFTGTVVGKGDPLWSKYNTSQMATGSSID